MAFEATTSPLHPLTGSALPSAEEREAAEARENFDASLREASGAGKVVLKKVIVPAAIGAGLLVLAGGVVATLLFSRLLRRNVTLLNINAMPPQHRRSGTRSLLGVVSGAGVRFLLPRVAAAVSNRLFADDDVYAGHDAESTPARGRARDTGSN